MKKNQINIENKLENNKGKHILKKIFNNFKVDFFKILKANM